MIGAGLPNSNYDVNTWIGIGVIIFYFIAFSVASWYLKKKRGE